MTLREILTLAERDELHLGDVEAMPTPDIVRGLVDAVGLVKYESGHYRLTAAGREVLTWARESDALRKLEGRRIYMRTCHGMWDGYEAAVAPDLPRVGGDSLLELAAALPDAEGAGKDGG